MCHPPDAPAGAAASKHPAAQPGAQPLHQQEQKRRLPGQLQTNLEQQQRQARKKQRRHTPETQLRWDIHQAAKNNDPLAALASYDRGVAEGAPVMHSYAVVAPTMQMGAGFTTGAVHGVHGHR